MKIIIAGAGKVGYTVADSLSAEGHDLTVIDRDPNTITELSNNLDVICVEGNAANPETLEEAGAAEADLVLAATRSDETNMICGITARKLGSKHVIARIRDTAYLRQIGFLREALGLSVVVNPEYECAMEISRMLRFPGAIRVDTFSKGNLEVMEHRVATGGKLDGVAIKDVNHLFKTKVLIGVIKRGDDAVIPNGSFVLAPGDTLEITGEARELRRFFTATGQYKKPVRRVMIMGGGRIAVYLTKLILAEKSMKVTIVEADRARCDELCDELSNAGADVRIVCGDATKNDVLQEEGILATDAFVALTGDDGSNIITSMYAKHCNVGKIVVKVNREYYADILESAGLDSVVTPKVLIAEQLVRYVRAMSNSEGSSMETLYRLADGKAEALEFKVSAGAACVGVPLKTLRLKPNVLISAIVRGRKTIIPDGETVICPGDHAVVITKAGWLKDLDSIVEDAR